MPELNWVGKDKVITHHLDVLLRIGQAFECQLDNIVEVVPSNSNFRGESLP